MTKTARELAALVQGEVDGDGDASVDGVAGLELATAKQLSFFANPKYKRALEGTKAGVVLVNGNAPPRAVAAYIRVQHPHLAFARVAQLFHPAAKHAPGHSPRAHIHPDALVDASATVMAGATISSGAVVGARAVLYPGVFIGEGARIGDDTVLHANASVMARCLVGARCLLHANCVIGADGFGFAFDADGPAHVKIPQVGIVRIEDDVEIGACSCVDRATTGETVIGRGSKIDNLVQVGHNCTVGPLSILCAQVGLSGTTELGTGVVMAGQAGSAGHLRIGDLAKIGGQAGIMVDVPAGASMLGSPAMPQRDSLRATAMLARLPEMSRELTKLRKRLDALEHAQEKKR